MHRRFDSTFEWLEADGRGGYAMGSATGIRTRRYHSLLTVALAPPTGRVHLVRGVEAFLETPDGRWALTSQAYPGVAAHPDGASWLASFEHDPWPCWRWRLPNGLIVEHEVVVVHERDTTLLTWRCPAAPPGSRLVVRPLLCVASLHESHRENGYLGFSPSVVGPATLRWDLYFGSPSLFIASNGRYRHDPAWYRQFFYAEEAARGLDATEDLASPGEFELAVDGGREGVVVLSAHVPACEPSAPGSGVELCMRGLRTTEANRRSRFASPLHRAADAYIVQRGEGRTIVAGYPWFEDWGRDTFIAMRGLCLATGRLREAGEMLTEWAGAVSEGMLPNRFPDGGGTPEYNSVDASLWYVVAAGEFLSRINGKRKRYREIEAAIEAILSGYARGTRFGIRADTDGLLAAGEPGVQLTWMDAKVGDWVVTPRIGKPVEVQALWINALSVGTLFNSDWTPLMDRAVESFPRRFWNPDTRSLFDVVDCDHQFGRCDASIRPNQILAVGGLPVALLDGDKARAVVERVERDLLTPLGLRTLAPGSSAYRTRYEGGPFERDGAYHQGTVWPWLCGPFVEAWLRVFGASPETIEEARRRFIEPLRVHLDEGGLGHVSEILDAEPPRLPRGCPFQAWSVGELIRAETLLDEKARANRRPAEQAPDALHALA